MNAGRCDRVTEVADYLSGVLEAAEAVGLEQHMNTCGVCRSTLSQTLDSAVEPAWLSLLRTSGITPEVSQPHVSAGSAGRYSKVRVAGSGGMSVVWEGWDNALQRTVALKYLHASHSSVAGIQRLLQEADALRRLAHRNIVTVYDLIASGHEPVLVMEYIDGMTLSKWQHGQPIAALDAAELTLAIVAALQHAHGSGIIHRDLKPSNILLRTDTPRVLPRDESGELAVKLSDFGIARIIGDHSLTATGERLGTPAYMAPEQITGDGECSFASDIYATGVLLYELLTGRPPFVASEPSVVLLLIQSAEPTPPRVLIPMLPRDIETICLKCLSRRPADRYQTAAELLGDLRAFLNGEPISAKPPGWLKVCRKWATRNRTVTALFASTTLGLIATCVLSLVALNSHRSRLAMAEQAGELATATAKDEKLLRERAELAEADANVKAQMEMALRQRHQDVLLKVITLADSNMRAGLANGQPPITNTSTSLLNPEYLATEVLRDYVFWLTDASRPLDWNDLELTVRYLGFKRLAGSFEDLETALVRVDEALEDFEHRPPDPEKFVEFVRTRQMFFAFDLPQSETLLQSFAQWMRIAELFLTQAEQTAKDDPRSSRLLAAREQAFREAHAAASTMKLFPNPAPDSGVKALRQLDRAMRAGLPHDSSFSRAILVLRFRVLCDLADACGSLGDHAAAAEAMQSARDYLQRNRSQIPPEIALQLEQQLDTKSGTSAPDQGPQAP